MAHLLSTLAAEAKRGRDVLTGDDLEASTDADTHDGAHTPSVTASDSTAPTLFHKIKNQRSILTLLVSDSTIFAGTQSGNITLWSLETFQILANVHAHRESVLCLYLSADKKLLFSSAGDAVVNVWCTTSLERQYSIYSKYDVGDVFSVVYSTELRTVYLGAQNTSIQVV